MFILYRKGARSFGNIHAFCEHSDELILKYRSSSPCALRADHGERSLTAASLRLHERSERSFSRWITVSKAQRACLLVSSGLHV